MGSRNSVNSVENAIANVLLKASGLNSRPSRSPRKKIGRNDVTMMSIENSSGRVIVAVAWMMVAIFSAGLDGAAPGQLRRAVLDDDDGRVGHLADGNGQSGEREQIDRLAERASGSAVNSVPRSSTQIGAIEARTFLRAMPMTRMTTISS